MDGTFPKEKGNENLRFSCKKLPRGLCIIIMEFAAIYSIDKTRVLKFAAYLDQKFYDVDILIVLIFIHQKGQNYRSSVEKKDLNNGTSSRRVFEEL
jgi:hypothetical protein